MDAEPSAEFAREPPQPSTEVDTRENGCGDGSSSDYNSDLSEHAEDNDDDLLAAQVDPSKTWLTLEDEDIESVERLAQCIRCDPLLPPPFAGSCFYETCYFSRGFELASSPLCI